MCSETLLVERTDEKHTKINLWKLPLEILMDTGELIY